MEEPVTYKLLTRWIYDNSIVQLDYWHSSNLSFSVNANLFPEKLWDVNGLILHVSTVYYPPYDIIDRKKSLKLRKT